MDSGKPPPSPALLDSNPLPPLPLSSSFADTAAVTGFGSSADGVDLPGTPASAPCTPIRSGGDGEFLVPSGRTPAPLTPATPFTPYDGLQCSASSSAVHTCDGGIGGAFGPGDDVDWCVFHMAS